MTEAVQPAGSDDPIDRETYARLLEMTGGDQAFVDDLVDTYLVDATDQLAALDAAIALADAAALTRPAHSLKSSSLNVGALGLGELCRELEQQGRAGETAGAAERVAGAHRLFEGVRSTLMARRAGNAGA
jgi:HPt (histidine-containing phosphotransfer) domain-containing protein